jgi:hypothetical protein
LDIEPEGPLRPAWKGFSGTPAWDLDSLDGNRDGAIDFQEMDRDHDGGLGPEECRYIARIRITMTTVADGHTITLACMVHPRNRMPAASEGNEEDVSAAAGVPYP